MHCRRNLWAVCSLFVCFVRFVCFIILFALFVFCAAVITVLKSHFAAANAAVAEAALMVVWNISANSPENKTKLSAAGDCEGECPASPRLMRSFLKNALFGCC